MAWAGNLIFKINIMNDIYIFLIVAIVISLLLIKGMVTTAAEAVYDALNKQIAIKFDEICRKQNENYEKLTLLMAEHADATEPDKKDRLLYDVAVWAIECRGLSTSAIQRHFSTSYGRAGKIVDQLYSMGICGKAQQGGAPRPILVTMDELKSLHDKGAFN